MELLCKHNPELCTAAQDCCVFREDMRTEPQPAEQCLVADPDECALGRCIGEDHAARLRVKVHRKAAFAVAGMLGQSELSCAALPELNTASAEYEGEIEFGDNSWQGVRSARKSLSFGYS